MYPRCAVGGYIHNEQSWGLDGPTMAPLGGQSLISVKGSQMQTLQFRTAGFTELQRACPFITISLSQVNATNNIDGYVLYININSEEKEKLVCAMHLHA